MTKIPSIGRLAKFGYDPGPWYTPAGTARDSQMGYGTPFQRSWLPSSGDYKAGWLRAQDSPTGGSTQAQHFSTGFKNWRSGQNWRQWFGTAMQGQLSRTFGSMFSGALGGNRGPYGRTPDYSFGTAFGGYDGGDLFRADGGDLAKRTLSEAEHRQRIEAAHASAEARRGRYHGTDTGAAPGVRQSAWGQIGEARGRQLPGGPSGRLGSNLRGLAAVSRKHDAEFRGVTPVSTRWFKADPQQPKDMSEEQYHDLARRASALTRALRDPILLRGQEHGLIPKDTDPRHVKLAFNHARNLALHDAGLFRYDFGFSEEDKPKLKELVPFMRYARRRMINDLRTNYKGQWKQFKEEFGEPFIDKKTGEQKVNRVTGEKRFRFYPHMEYVKSDQGELGKAVLPGSALAAGAGTALRAGRWALGFGGRALSAGASAMTRQSVRQMARANYRRSLERSRDKAHRASWRAYNSAFKSGMRTPGMSERDAYRAAESARIKAFATGMRRRRPSKFGALPTGAKFDRLALGGAAAYGAYGMMRPNQPQY